MIKIKDSKTPNDAIGQAIAMMVMLVIGMSLAIGSYKWIMWLINL